MGLAIVTALFVCWVTLFQLQWRAWGGWGVNLLIYNPDTAWWTDTS